MSKTAAILVHMRGGHADFVVYSKFGAAYGIPIGISFISRWAWHYVQVRSGRNMSLVRVWSVTSSKLHACMTFVTGSLSLKTCICAHLSVKCQFACITRPSSSRISMSGSRNAARCVPKAISGNPIPRSSYRTPAA